MINRLKQVVHTAFFIGLSALAITGCRTVKPIESVITQTDSIKGPVIVVDAATAKDSADILKGIVQKIRSTAHEYGTFTGKMKLDYTDMEGKSQSATAFVRLQKDSLMWVSVTGALGVEGFRALINADSVILMDKIQKTISRRSIASLQEIVGLPLDFSALQDIIVGNPVYFSDSITAYKADATGLIAMSAGDFFKHTLTMDTLKNVVLNSRIEEIDDTKKRVCQLWFEDYSMQQEKNFSMTRAITVTEKKTLSIQLRFQEVMFNEAVSFPFNIPKSYNLK